MRYDIVKRVAGDAGAADSLRASDLEEVERRIGDMRVIRLYLQFAAFVMVFNVLACAPASTKFSELWKDGAYQGPPAKILVINMFKDASIRGLFQDEMVKALKEHNVDAVAKRTVVAPDQVVYNMEAMAAQAKEVGADTVLITKPAGFSENSYLNTRTDVYDMKTNKLISFVSAETRMRMKFTDLQDYYNYVPSYVKDLVNKLSEAGLFKRKV
jgi:hypothetical protein